MADTSANCQERAALRTNSQSTEWLKSMSVVQRHAYAIRLAKERSTSTPAYLKHVYRFETRVKTYPRYGRGGREVGGGACLSQHYKYIKIPPHAAAPETRLQFCKLLAWVTGRLVQTCIASKTFSDGMQICCIYI